MRKIELSDEEFAFLLEQAKFQATIAARTAKAVVVLSERRTATEYFTKWALVIRRLEMSQ